MTNKKDGVLYIGITNNLIRRVAEHKENINKCFTSRYKLYTLVYYEEYKDVELAIEREKQMKKWKREWKIKRIVEMNPSWEDLYTNELAV